METLSSHSDENTRIMAIKITIFVEANVINFQIHHPYGIWGDLKYIFRKYNVLVAMATNQIQQFGQISYIM